MKKSKKKEIHALESVKKDSFKKDNYHTIVLEQYKMYGQILEENHNRYMSTIKFFISIQIIFLSSFLVIIKKEVVVGVFGVIMLLIVSLSICISWLMVSKSHYKLTKAKHETLEEMEYFLPLKPFSHEWHNKLKSGDTYLSMRTVFFSLPIILSIIYISLGIIIISKT